MMVGAVRLVGAIGPVSNVVERRARLHAEVWKGLHAKRAEKVI